MTCYQYAGYKTKQEAMDALEDLYASGEVFPSEVYGLMAKGRKFYIMLKLHDESDNG